MLSLVVLRVPPRKRAYDAPELGPPIFLRMLTLAVTVSTPSSGALFADSSPTPQRTLPCEVQGSPELRGPLSLLSPVGMVLACPKCRQLDIRDLRSGVLGHDQAGSSLAKSLGHPQPQDEQQLPLGALP